MKRSPFDARLAQSFIDKNVLIGITYVDGYGRALERKQFFGRIVRIDQTEGVFVILDGDTREVRLPPRLDSFRRADPGEYHLHSTGKVITNPDLLSTWTLRKQVFH